MKFREQVSGNKFPVLCTVFLLLFFQFPVGKHKIRTTKLQTLTVRNLHSVLHAYEIL